MPDRLDKLRQTLSQLEEELRSVDSLDEATRAQLAEAADEIMAAVERGSRSEATRRAEGSLQDRLAEFEASHPQLAGVVSRVLDGLAQLGI
jgi:cytochrome c556